MVTAAASTANSRQARPLLCGCSRPHFTIGLCQPCAYKYRYRRSLDPALTPERFVQLQAAGAYGRTALQRWRAKEGDFSPAQLDSWFRHVEAVRAAIGKPPMVAAHIQEFRTLLERLN